MARAPRFPVKCEFFTTEEQFAALEMLEANSLLTKSDHLRQALDGYLRHWAASMAPATNGHARQQPRVPA